MFVCSFDSESSHPSLTNYDVLTQTGSQSSSRELVSSLTEDWVRVPSPSSSQPDSLGPPTSQTNDTSENSLNQQYDVFLSFAEEDERFAEEVRQRLVENTKAKVFVPSSGKYHTAHLASFFKGWYS